MLCLCAVTVRCWPHWLQTRAGYCPSCTLCSLVETSASAPASGWHMWVWDLNIRSDVILLILQDLEKLSLAYYYKPEYIYSTEIGQTKCKNLLNISNNNDCLVIFHFIKFFSLCSWHWSTDRAKTTRCALLLLLAAPWRTMKKRWVESTICGLILMNKEEIAKC